MCVWKGVQPNHKRRTVQVCMVTVLILLYSSSRFPAISHSVGMWLRPKNLYTNLRQHLLHINVERKHCQIINCIG